jgi:hypothetical protein
MRRSIALVAAILTVSLGLLASLPAEAGSKHGNKHGFKHGYGHGAKQAYRHGQKRYYGYRRHGHLNYGHRGFDGDTYLAAVGIVAGTRLVEAYIHRPRAPQPAPVVYAAPVQPRPCYQVMVPYVHPYGGTYYAPQVQCY